MADWRDENVKPIKFDKELMDELMEVWDYLWKHGYKDGVTTVEMVKAYAIARK